MKTFNHLIMESVCYLEDTQSVCRICFEIKTDARSLFSIKEDRCISEELVKYANLNFHLNDGGPTTICGQCFKEFNVFMTFLDKCKRSNDFFHQFKQNQKDTSHIDSSINFSICVADGKNTEDGSNGNEDCQQDNLTQILNNHKSKGAPRKRGSHTCQLCCKVFTRKFNYKLHLERHSGERGWQCRQCGAACPTRAQALRHCAARARKPCPAPGCGKSFTSVTNLNTHIRRHNGERPYSCAECGKSFGSKNTLSAHARIHTGVKPYMCPACGKRFATNKLSAHMRTHAARAHACATCARRFPDARAVRLHARTHAPPAREHACAACPARYNHKQSLNKHLRKRHGLKTS